MRLGSAIIAMALVAGCAAVTPSVHPAGTAVAPSQPSAPPAPTTPAAPAPTPGPTATPAATVSPRTISQLLAAPHPAVSEATMTAIAPLIPGTWGPLDGLVWVCEHGSPNETAAAQFVERERGCLQAIGYEWYTYAGRGVARAWQTALTMYNYASHALGTTGASYLRSVLRARLAPSAVYERPVGLSAAHTLATLYAAPHTLVTPTAALQAVRDATAANLALLSSSAIVSFAGFDGRGDRATTLGLCLAFTGTTLYPVAEDQSTAAYACTTAARLLWSEYRLTAGEGFYAAALDVYEHAFALAGGNPSALQFLRDQMTIADR